MEYLEDAPIVAVVIGDAGKLGVDDGVRGVRAARPPLESNRLPEPGSLGVSTARSALAGAYGAVHPFIHGRWARDPSRWPRILTRSSLG